MPLFLHSLISLICSDMTASSETVLFVTSWYPPLSIIHTPNFVTTGILADSPALLRILEDKHIAVARVNADGTKPNLSQGGLYVAGYGIAGYKMAEEIGWSGSNMYQLAQISDKVWQITGVAVEERDPDVKGGKFRYDYISMKYYYQSGWGGEASKGITIGGPAASLLKQTSGGNLELNANLEKGATYRLTVDLTGAVISGNGLSSGAETVSFEKL